MSEYIRTFNNFRGIDATSEPGQVADNRFSYAENMYKDYETGQGVSVETFPGTRTICKNLDGKVFGIHAYKVSSGKVHIIVHAGTKLYHFDSAERDKLNNIAPAEFPSITMKEAKSSSFVYNNRMYLIDGENYIVVYENSDKELEAEYIDKDTAYVPTTFLNEVEYEQRNMLTNKFIEKSHLEKLDHNIIEPYLGDQITTDFENGLMTVLVCPEIRHRCQEYEGNPKYKIIRCRCGDYYAPEKYQNKMGIMWVEIPFVAEHVKIDFGQVKIAWSCCKEAKISSGMINHYYFTTDGETNGSFATTVLNRKDKWEYHLDEDELISIEELRERKENKDTKSEEGYYQFPYYQGISEDYLTDEYGEINRRKLFYFLSMYDNVITITGTLEGCQNLSDIYLSNNITTLCKKFFAETAIKTAYLPYNLTTLGELAFENCNNLKQIFASAKKIINSGLEMISMYEILNNKKEYYGIGDNVEIISYESKFMSGVPHDSSDVEAEETPVNRVYIRTPCEQIKHVSINGAEIPELITIPEDDGIVSLSKKVTFYTPIYKYIDGKRYVAAIDFYHQCYCYRQYDEIVPGGYTKVNGDVEIQGEAYPSVFTTLGELAEEADKDVVTSHKNYNGDSLTAIKHCTVCCAFDDRIFFTGNPELPNTVFYTHRDLTGHNNPAYVGVLNWFDDGVGNVQNSAMMSSATMLMVLKGDTAQDGSIFYHTGQTSDNGIIPRIYPSVEGVPGLGCAGVAVNFRDDCVFMSHRGLEAVAKQTVNLERTVEHRSTNIDALFKGLDLSRARAAEWNGYLCILIDGKLYLADSRQMYQGIGGAIEYEWYYVDGIGEYIGDNPRYYTESYDGELPEGIDIYPDRVAVDYKTVITDMSTDIKYAELNGKKVVVCETEEREGGTFNEATEILCVDDVLYFGTKSGGILCLNSDKRGVDGKIPENTYNRCGHAYTSLLALKLDNAGVPYFTKNTVKRSPTFNLKPFINSAIKIEVATDRVPLELIAEQHSNNILDFDEFDFSNLAFQNSNRSIFVIKERTKKWTEKQYVISSDRHNSPFGIYELSYRYEIAGRIKK